MGRFTVVSTDVIDTLQLDAGVILDSFDPANPVKPSSDNIIATTTGGVNPTISPAYSDLFEDVDNMPANTIEGKHLDSVECSLGFTTLKFNAANLRWSIGAADITSGAGYQKITPRRNLQLSDFADCWWVGDKANGGAIAIRLINALSTGGLSIQTTKNGKGTNAVTLTGHVSIQNQDVVPMEIYDIEPPDATLSALTIASLTLSPTFSQSVTSYTASTTDASNAITATATDSTNATVTIKNGATTVTSGSAATWATGTNTVTVTVTNGGASKTYTVTVTKTDEG